MELESTNTILDGALVSRLRAGIESLFAVRDVRVPPKEPQGMLVFEGDLLHADSEYVYANIAETWHALDYTPMLRRGDTAIELVAMPGVVKPKPSNPAINIALFVVTVISVLVISALNEGVDLLQNPFDIIKGLPFTLAFLAILGTHEFGHYFAARYHKVAVTLPYFIPFPTIWGTFGAFIQLRSPTLTRKQLFDVGIAGPIAGLVVAIPILFIGLANSTVETLPVAGGFIMEGNSIFYWLAKYAVFGQALPANGMDVFLHPLAWAGWSGLLVTAFNLFPVGQLDGGHVAFVLFGKATKIAGYVVVAAMVAAGYFFWQGWIFWAVMIFLFIGVGHPPPLNDLAPIGRGRKTLGYAMIVVFILLFTPVPLVIM